MRPIERDYLKTFADRITLAEWSAICDAALTAAKEGDAKAREWITRLVLGSDPMQLSGLARRETLGIDAPAEIEAEIDYDSMPAMQRLTIDVRDPLQLAVHNQEHARRREAAAAELEQRKQEREARKALKAGKAAATD